MSLFDINEYYADQVPKKTKELNMGATGILILGESGTGKSTSIRNLPKDKTGIVNVNGKRLPFKNGNTYKVFNTDNYQSIEKSLVQTKAEIVVIDDVQYLMMNEFMRNISEKGYEKFNQLASNFWTLTETLKYMRDDQTVYFLSHLETDQFGVQHMKTIGKLVDEKIVPEGLFGIVLKTAVKDGGYFFSTQNSGSDTVKSPMGMFDDAFIPNDLFLVDTAIRDYYGLNNKAAAKAA